MNKHLARIEKATKTLSNPKNIERLIIEASKPFEAEIIDFNTSQLAVGKLSDGGDTLGYASLPYTNYKSSLGSQSVPNADLKVTGSFWAKFFITFKAFSLVIGSRDKKAPDLENKYTNFIYGLTNTNKPKASKLIAPNFVKLIRNVFK